jgi:hypothetical protein
MSPAAAVAAPKPTTAAAPKSAPQSRMRLDKLVKGRLTQPKRVVLYGPEGIGKSTFAASAPGPIFLGAEDGTGELDVVRFPFPETFAEVREAIRTLTLEKHDFQTLVIDTLDWIEPLIWSHCCTRDGESNIEGYGYGKGYVAAMDEWRALISDMERLRQAKPMHVLFLAHSSIRSFKNPQGEDYDRFELKLHAKAAGLVKEWSDAVLFANYETFAKKDEKTKRVRGVDTGARLVHTERRAAFDAKNRYGLPQSLPLSWPDFEAAVEAGQTAAPSALVAEIQRKARELGGELEKKILETLAKAGEDPRSLALINNRVNAKLAEREE